MIDIPSHNNIVLIYSQLHAWKRRVTLTTLKTPTDGLTIRSTCRGINLARFSANASSRRVVNGRQPAALSPQFLHELS